MRKNLLALSAVALAVPFLALSTMPGAAAGATPSCDGRQATIVGSPDKSTVKGTNGPDVIVSDGSQVVDSGKGDDLVCLTDGLKKVEYTVLARAGDDQVYVRFTQARTVNATLGDGSDTYEGGRGTDNVVANDYSTRRTPLGEEFGVDAEPDVIHTGDGADDVVSGGVNGVNDVIDTGSGDDYVEIRTGRMGDGGSLVGGSGADQLRVAAEYLASTSTLEIDNVKQTATYDGVVAFAWSGLETFGLDADDVTMIGGDRDEGYVGAATTVDAHMGGGDDFVQASSFFDAPPSTIYGGRGHDAVQISLGKKGRGPVTADLAEGTVSADDSPLVELHGIEKHRFASLADLTVLGTSGADRIEVIGCRSTTRSLGGDDVVHLVTDREDLECPRDPRQAAYGGPGDDRLSGSRDDDLLQGGAGRDVAIGNDGSDRCSAEVIRSCERGV